MAATDDGKIIGHILFSMIIETDEGIKSTQGLAPLFAIPAWQKKVRSRNERFGDL
ncbi:hypothetical protein [Peribacillus glennii]|uniref:hypothetical protein n=1 Tax=Peribacillus glennii TaxID=2303991 RepID=UPI0013140BA0|nr:hypothetical protein [Peribacillus glennii]